TGESPQYVAESQLPCAITVWRGGREQRSVRRACPPDYRTVVSVNDVPLRLPLHTQRNDGRADGSGAVRWSDVPPGALWRTRVTRGRHSRVGAGERAPADADECARSSPASNVKVLTFFNHAGGVAKTSTVRDVGYVLGEMGRRVLLIDVDPQANLTKWMGIDDDIELDETIYPGVM